MNRDLAWGAVRLLLHGDGLDGSTAISDSSPSRKAVTANGNARISTAQSLAGGSSIYFDGVGSFLTIGSSASEWSWLSSMQESFTVESYIYKTSNSSYQCIMQYGDNNTNLPSFSLLFNSGTSAPYFGIGGSGGSFGNAPNLSIGLNTWGHVAFDFNVSTGVGTVYVNGAISSSGTKGAGTFSSPSVLPRIGRYQGGSFPFAGYMEEFCIIRGLALYDGVPFSPPPPPLKHGPDWWGTVRHGFGASHCSVSAPRMYSGARPARPAATRADNSAGPGSILGTVKVDTLPVTRKVRLFDVASGSLLKETWSDTAGVYRFDGLALDRPYTVLSHDHQRDYNATVADYVYAEVLP